jgi:hypothetical protein
MGMMVDSPLEKIFLILPRDDKKANEISVSALLFIGLKGDDHAFERQQISQGFFV